MGHLICLGLNHTTAPLEIRERLSFTPSTLHAALDRLSRMDDSGPDGIAEAAIVSTCNRLEVYALSAEPQRAEGTLKFFLSEAHAVPEETFRDHLYTYVDADAVTHLMRVASGLDSLVLGEPQILGQVGEAFQAGMAHGAVGTVLSKLFQASIHAGKRARAETAIGINPASIGSTAVQLASRVFGDLKDCEVMVAGAGDMGELAVRALMARGARGLLVANRTYDRAVQLARQWNGEAMTFERLREGLARADIVITATDAPHSILHVSQVQEAMEVRDGRPLIIVDIAVPRDVEPEVAEVPQVHLFNIDDLQAQVENNLGERRAEIPKVEDIIEVETAAFVTWLASLEVVPTIAELRRHADDLRQAELERALNRLNDLSETEREVVQQLSTRLVNKLLHDPVTRLKNEAAGGNGVAFIQTTRNLFGLGQD